MLHDGPPVPVFDEDSDEGHTDKDVIGVVVLRTKQSTSYSHVPRTV